MVILVGLWDMDGSLFDYDSALMRDLLQLRAPNEAPLPNNLHDAEREPHLNARMELIKRQPGWWRNLPPIPEGIDLFEYAASLGFLNTILTKGPTTKPDAWKEKLECCHLHFGPGTPVNVVTDKSLVYGKFLYDDFPPYQEKWLKHRPRGWGIMRDAPYNRGFEHPRVVRYSADNTQPARDLLLALAKGVVDG